MRLSKADKETKIIELHKAGWSYMQLQKRYHSSPGGIARLVKGIVVECAICGKPKGKIRFHAHHPNKANRPHYTIPLCPRCHATEEARLRKPKQSQPLTPATTTSIPAKRESASAALPSYPCHPLSKTEKKAIVGSIITLVALEAFPSLLDDIQCHWQQTNNSGKRAIMGLKRSYPLLPSSS